MWSDEFFLKHALVKSNGGSTQGLGG